MGFLKRIYVLLVLALGIASFGSTGFTETLQDSKVTEPVEALKVELDGIDKELSEFKNSDEDLEKLLGRLEQTIAEAQDYREKLTPKLNDLQSQINDLGPKPKDGAPAEAEGVAAERERLGKLFGIYDSTAKKSLVVQTRARQLIRRVQDTRRSMFADQTLKRWSSPLSPWLWQQVYSEAPYAYRAVMDVFSQWVLRAGSIWRIVGIAIPCLGVWFGLAWMVRLLAARLSMWRSREKVSFFRRSVCAVAISLARMVPPIAAALLFYYYMSSIGTFTEQTDKFAWSIVFAFSVYVMIASLSRTLLAPNRSEWRLFDLPDDASRRLSILIKATAWVYAFDILWLKANSILYTPLSLTLLESFVASTMFAILFIAMLLIPLRETPGREEDMFAGMQPEAVDRLWPWWLKIPLALMILAILVSATLGYIPLANFLAGQVLISGAILVVTLLVYQAISEFCEMLNHEQGLLDGGGDLGLVFSEPRRRQISALIELGLRAVLFALVLPLFLLQWGFAWSDIRGWIYAAFFGFKVGPIELSLVAILAAVGIFVVGVILTRMVQKWLSDSLLRSPPMRPGIAHSIRVGVGYLGYIISALIAFSYSGFDLTNLAIVAGALSVGIGFGLQSIVNNFVSGLILLVERPIRVGDWVIVGDHQGHVRRISVRSTEIETFDRSTVIVPNSDLITSTVVNWTHGSALGRVTIPLGVGYDSDPQQVYDMLMEIGMNHPKILKDPAPLVVFEDFGPSSLDFTLRVYVPNIGQSLGVRTELRMQILEACRKNNIEIPFPQRDLNIKTDSLGIEAPVLVKR